MDQLTLVLLAKEIHLKANELGAAAYGATVSATVLVSAAGKSYRATISREASRDWTTREKLLNAIVRVSVFADHSSLATNSVVPPELRRQIIEEQKAQFDEVDRDLRKWVAHFIADRLVVDEG